LDEDPFSLYKSKGFSRTRLLLKAEGFHKQPRRFYSLEADKSVVWNLRGKVVVENPVIFVVFSDHADFFTGGDESYAGDPETAQEPILRISISAEKKFKKKNFVHKFFATSLQ
jgi:hypothetical protein